MPRIDNPCTIQHIYTNINNAISILSSKVEIPSKMQTVLNEAITRGLPNYVWALLSLIKESYASVSNPRRGQFHLEKINLGYNDQEVKQLEQSIIAWLKSLGIVRQVNSIQSIIDIEANIKNGTLLCKLVSLLFSCSILGVNENPRTKASELSNIRKALEVLRKQQSMPQRYVYYQVYMG